MKSTRIVALIFFITTSLAPHLVNAQGGPTEPIPPTTTTELVATTLPPLTTVAPSPKRRSKASIALVQVVLSEQRAYVYAQNKSLVATIAVSTGLDNSTPTGSFKVFSKSPQSFYEPNPTERMRWMVRFTKGRQGGNIGFHSIPYKVTPKGEVKFFTPIGLAPSSHGCIRVRDVDAKWLFANMGLGTRVVVKNTRK
ncbi:MAG: murein L,D-transpeptidase [Ilumatobacteraceae bacterium]|nr:murein L,D-transpeptidase [Ilumatobacteraceae bacterium]